MIGSMMTIDMYLFRLINDLAGRWAPVDSVARLLTWIGWGGLVWVAIALVLIWRRRVRLGLALTLLLAGTGLLDTAIKWLVGRPRPPLTLPDVNLLLPLPTSYSFLSGHALTSFAAASLLALALREPRSGTGVLGLAAAIGWSRIHVGHHYPSDVLAGALLGALAGWIAWIFVAPSLRPPHSLLQ